MASQSQQSASTNNHVVVREASPIDVEAIIAIVMRTLPATFAYSAPAKDFQTYLDETFTKDRVLNELSSPAHRFFVATQQSEVTAEEETLGYIQMTLGTTEPFLPQDAPICQLHRIYVSMDHLGKGIGKMLIERGLMWARETLLDTRVRNGDGETSSKAGVWLGVLDSYEKGQQIYRRFGFEIVGAHDFVAGQSTQTDLVMFRWLD